MKLQLYHTLIKKKLFLFFLLLLGTKSYGQTCQNCGVNQSNPQASLHVKGCGSTNSTFSFKASNSLNKTALFVHDDLKVGVGAATNLYQLEVSDTNSVSGIQPVMRIANRYVATANNGSQILFGLNRTTTGMTNVAGIAGVITDITSSAYKGALVFSTADNTAPLERMRIDYSGKVGIGTNLPEKPLHIQSTAEWGILMRSSHSTPAIRNNILIQRSNGSSAVSAGFILGGVGFGGYDGTNYGSGWDGGAEIMAIATQNWTSTARGTAMVFNTTKNGIASGLEKMRIENNGYVGIGTSTPFYKLHVKGGGPYGEIFSLQDSSAAYQMIFATRAPTGVYNPLTLSNDNGIYWMDDASVEENNGFVIAPWSNSAKGLRIDGNGNVGIGTNSANYKLEVAGDVYAIQGSLITSFSSAEGGRVELYNHSKVGRETRVYTHFNMNSQYGNKYSLYGYSADGLTISERFSIWDSGDITFHDSSAVCNVKFHSNGNVGIGTTSSVTNARLSLKDGHLQIQQTTTPTISIDGTAASASLTNATDVAGKITLTPATNSTKATILFVKAYAVAPVVILTPANSAAAQELVSARIHVTTTTTTCVINFGAAPTTSEKQFHYVVIETQ